LAALGTQLLARGHRVRVLAPSELGPRFEADGIACRDLRFGDLRAVADDLIAEAGPDATDVIVVDYMQPDALSAAEHTGLPVVAFVHTLYESQAVGPLSPMIMVADAARLNPLRAHLGLPPVDRITEVLDRAARVLVTTVPEL